MNQKINEMYQIDEKFLKELNNLINLLMASKQSFLSARELFYVNNKLLNLKKIEKKEEKNDGKK